MMVEQTDDSCVHVAEFDVIAFVAVVQLAEIAQADVNNVDA